MLKLNPVVLTAFLPLSLLSLLLSCAGSPGTSTDKPVVLVVSFGTTVNETRDKTIGAIEKAIAAAYPDHEIRRAFTSQIVIDRLAKRDGLKVDNVEQAMNRLVNDKVKDLIIQPTLIMNGHEYDEKMETIKPFEKRFTSVRYGQPLLISDADFTETTSILIENTKQFNAEDTAVVFMGHGSDHEANEVYLKLDRILKNRGGKRYFVGTVEAEPSIEEIMGELKPLGVKRVVLLPLMIVAGDHAVNDMAGDEEDSWKSILEEKGFEVIPVLRGLGEYPEMQKIFVRHVAEAAQKR